MYYYVCVLASFNAALFQQQLSFMQVRPASKSVAKFAKLEVLNVPHNVTELEFRKVFSKYGNVEETHMLMDKELSYFTCHAYVRFETPEEALEAIQELDGTFVDFKPTKTSNTEDQHVNVPLIVRFARDPKKTVQKKNKTKTKKGRHGGGRHGGGRNGGGRHGGGRHGGGRHGGGRHGGGRNGNNKHGHERHNSTPSYPRSYNMYPDHMVCGEGMIPGHMSMSMYPNQMLPLGISGMNHYGMNYGMNNVTYMQQPPAEIMNGNVVPSRLQEDYGSFGNGSFRRAPSPRSFQPEHLPKTNNHSPHVVWHQQRQQLLMQAQQIQQMQQAHQAYQARQAQQYRMYIAQIQQTMESLPTVQNGTDHYTSDEIAAPSSTIDDVGQLKMGNCTVGAENAQNQNQQNRNTL